MITTFKEIENLFGEINNSMYKKTGVYVIGGAALLRRGMKAATKDIDIVVDIKELQKLKQENLLKNDKLKKYEIKIEEIDVDIYVSHFSKLTIAPENLKKYTQKIWDYFLQFFKSGAANLHPFSFSSLSCFKTSFRL